MRSATLSPSAYISITTFVLMVALAMLALPSLAQAQDASVREMRRGGYI